MNNKNVTILLATVLCFGLLVSCSKKLTSEEVLCATYRPKKSIQVTVYGENNASFENGSYSFDKIKKAFMKRNNKCYSASIIIAVEIELEPNEFIKYVEDARILGVNPTILRFSK